MAPCASGGGAPWSWRRRGLVAWPLRGGGRWRSSLARRGPEPRAAAGARGRRRAASAQLQAELARLARAQDELRQDVQRGREASLLQLADAAQGIRGELGQAQRALAEVKALEQGRARQMDQAADSLRRLEAVVAGSSTRGAAGENILARALASFRPTCSR